MIFKRKKKRKIYEMGPSGGDEKRARFEREDDFWPWKGLKRGVEFTFWSWNWVFLQEIISQQLRLRMQRNALFS